MKSLPASLALAAAAVFQAMGMYQFTGDSITVTGQVFFPLLFALMAIYLAWRNQGPRRFALVHVILMLLGFAALVLSVIGDITMNFFLYPSPILYYSAFGLLVIELFLRILATPKKSRRRREAEDLRPRVRRRQRVAGQGPTNLVARSKGSSDAAAPSTDSGTAENSKAE